MLISVLLLLLFITQWIRTQYREAENRLHNDAQLIFTTVENNIRDSLLNLQVAAVMQQTAGKDTLDRPDIFIRDAAPPADSGSNRRSIHLFTGKPGSGKLVPHHDITTPKTIILGPEDTPEEQETANKVLRIALQEIINNIDVAALRIQTDPVLLKKEFSLALNRQFREIRVAGATQKDTTSLFTYQAKAPGQQPVYLALANYHFYLFRAILPQAAFCLLLLLLTSLAFVLAYLNTRKQLLFAQQKDDFISNISHELKTPVATTKIAIEALNSYDAMEDPERARRYLGMAAWEINRLETMIGKIMDTAQADHGMLLLDREKLNLTQIVQEITSSLEQVFIEQQLTLQLNVLLQNAYVQGDPIHLTGAIYNLLDNAIKYGYQLIRVDIYHTKGHLNVKVADKGTGIPKAYQDKIFEQFVRVPQENIHNVKGYGLGLSYARYVIEAHKGSLTLEQEAGWGAVFHICLPEFSTDDEV